MCSTAASTAKTTATTGSCSNMDLPGFAERNGGPGIRDLHLGGAEGTRTPDPHTASVVRYQLRHSPKLPEKVIKHRTGT